MIGVIEKVGCLLTSSFRYVQIHEHRYFSWHIIANDSKYAARIEILQTILHSVQNKNLGHLEKLIRLYKDIL
jgi:hypothetical protein